MIWLPAFDLTSSPLLKIAILLPCTTLTAFARVPPTRPAAVEEQAKFAEKRDFMQPQVVRKITINAYKVSTTFNSGWLNVINRIFVDVLLGQLTVRVRRYSCRSSSTLPMWRNIIIPRQRFRQPCSAYLHHTLVVGGVCIDGIRSDDTPSLLSHSRTIFHLRIVHQKRARAGHKRSLLDRSTPKLRREPVDWYWDSAVPLRSRKLVRRTCRMGIAR